MPLLHLRVIFLGKLRGDYTSNNKIIIIIIKEFFPVEAAALYTMFEYSQSIGALVFAI